MFILLGSMKPLSKPDQGFIKSFMYEEHYLVEFNVKKKNSIFNFMFYF